MKVIDVISLEDRYFYVQFVMRLYTFEFQNGLPDSLSMDRLLTILKGYGEYPAKYR